MSFYGSTYYQLLDTFYKIVMKNSGLGKATFIANTPKDSYEFQAVGRKGILEIDTGNKWIQIEKMIDENGQGKFVFWHSSPDKLKTSSLAIKYTAPETNSEGQIIVPSGDNFIPLSGGSTLQFFNLKYDNAGHITEGESASDIYYIPIPQESQNIDDLQLTVYGKNEIISPVIFSIQESDDSGADNGSVHKGLYDSLAYINTSLKSTKNKIASLNSNLNNFISETNEKFVNVNKTYSNLVKTIDEEFNNIKINIIGGLDVMYPSSSTTTVTNSIGNIEEAILTINENEIAEGNTLSKLLIKVDQKNAEKMASFLGGYGQEYIFGYNEDGYFIDVPSIYSLVGRPTKELKNNVILTLWNLKDSIDSLEERVQTLEGSV